MLWLVAFITNMFESEFSVHTDLGPFDDRRYCAREAMSITDSDEDSIMQAIDRIRAGGMTRSPSRRNFNIVTSCRSRLSVTSQRMVASEPAIDKFGPRSTPISTAPVTCAGT